MRFFNKTFLKFTLGFLAIIAVSLFLIAATSAYAVGVSKIVFTTEEQSIKPNELSNTITIQTQDAGSNSILTPETIDLEFTSASATGEFLGSTGNPVTKTMNKNTSNRNFFYRDSASGTFIITVKATGRDSGEIWDANQKIMVSTGAPQSTDGEVLGENTEKSTSSSGENQSATSGSTAPSYSTPATQLEVVFGGDRLTSPGSPITFQAIIKKNSVSNEAVKFYWSYGDGTVGEGALVTHMYKYPGEYAAVLNAHAGNISAVSRTRVKVAPVEIGISVGDGYLELTNNSNLETNLFNWKIVHQGMGFIFQPDTIIFPKSKIKIDLSLLSMKGEAMGNTTLTNFLGQEVVSTLEANPSEQVEKIWQETISILDKAIEQKLVYEKQPAKPLAPPTELVLGTSTEATSTTIENIIFETPKKEGILNKAWHFLVSVIR